MRGRARRAWSGPWCLAVLAACGCGGAGAAVPLPPLLDVQTPEGFPSGPLAGTAPAENALTEARALLGKRLFFDARLSRTRQLSCSSCHRPEHAFADPARVSTGVEGRQGTRHAPALINLAWGASFFWDGRAASLEEQAGLPIQNVLEMDLSLNEAVARLNAEADYGAAFVDAYGGPPSEMTLRFALASFVRALVSGRSPYDEHLRGDDARFGAAEARGEALFFSERAACFHCHPPGALTNEGYFNNGTFDAARSDPGRQALTGRTGDLGKFKVPGLRNVAAHPPYMHDGSLDTLEAVVDQYDRGGGGHPSTDPQVHPLGLSSADKGDLLAFLRALTDPRFLEDPRYRP